MRIVLAFILCFNFAFSSNLPKEHILNNIKSLIQKEEFLSLAINRYIVENGKLPKKDGVLDWKILEDGKYLVNFDKKSPFLNKDLIVSFDANNNIFIQGIVLVDADFNSDLKYAYNIYTDSIFRVNTVAPSNNSNTNTLKANLTKGTQVAYSNIQKNIVEKLNNGDLILLSNKKCTDTNKYFYELKGKDLVYKYCKANVNTGIPTHIDVYQKAPLYLEDASDLRIIRGNIGDRAYVKLDNGSWEEYYFDSETESGWVSIFTGKAAGGNSNSDQDLSEQMINYIPQGKDLIIRTFGGCYLAYGDVFCWGDNKYKKAGIESYGQLDTSLKPDFINTPVMLKVALENPVSSSGDSLDIISKSWYNSIYRVKFEKIGMNSKNVCGVSPIFTEEKLGKTTKIGGDLYCNGLLDWNYFEKPYSSKPNSETTTSILSKHKFFAQDKGEVASNKNPIFLTDIAMLEDTTLVLGHKSDVGRKDLYVFGKNTKGALGINSNDENITETTPVQINIASNGLQDINFKQIVATRDAKMFGALDNDNYFYIWGETPKGTLYKPTQISSTKYQEDIQVQSRTFVLKEANVNGKFVYINSNNGLSDFTKNSEDEIEVIVYYDNKTPYINQKSELKELSSQNNFLKCKTMSGGNCGSDENKLFTDSLAYLNRLETGQNSDGEDITSASFTNIGVFKSHLDNQIDYGVDSFEDFESSENGWKYLDKSGSTQTAITQNKVDNSYVLGLFGKNNTDTVTWNPPKQSLFKEYSLGSSFANQNVKISFDMFAIGSWDADNPSYTGIDSFFIFINDNLVRSDMFGDYQVNGTWVTKDTHQGTSITVDVNSNYNYGKKHYYELTTKADNNGKIKLGFGAMFNDDVNDEFYAIDNVRISKKIDNTLFINGEYIEDFENNKYDSWIIPRGPIQSDSSYKDIYKTYPIFDGGINSKFLGRFGRVQGQYTYFGGNEGNEQVYKVFSFGSNYAGKKVKLTFDAYIIDNWKFNSYQYSDDNDALYLFINEIKETIYDARNHASYNNKTEITIPNTASKKDLKVKVEREVILDEYGNVKIGFGAFNRYNDRHVESSTSNNMMSWGIDNIKFEYTTNSSGGSGGSSSSEQPFICAKTGIGVKSQLYCWGNVGRSLPILNTGLYDISKIPSVNKLFITQESENMNQMAYDNYNNAGNLFLKYPTYISGFDYDFKFK
ncbi:hypothetical protein [Arcobacter vandammei]|uniref:hypothetical protein n=1 Tax=Arcobacter vandammei TaxID=2782243 RepID=UPI0018DEFC78|nr:hypothetical protein [Arcobacter vandammei]